MKITLADGRMFLLHTAERYDFMMLDVYKDELYIPFHLATKEFFELASSRLTENGSMVMNIAALSSDSELLVVLRNTVTAAFPHVYEYRAADSYNSLLFAFKSEPNFLAIGLSSHPLELRTLLNQILRGIKRVEFDANQEVALDNRSPIEFLTEKMVLSEAL
jgi:spermidine synthase